MKVFVRRTVLLIGIIALIGFALLSLVPNDEPRFNGKRISHYLRQMEIVDDGTNQDLRWKNYQEATNALKQMGPTAVDWLAKNLENKQDLAPGRLERIVRLLPGQLRSLWPSEPVRDLLNRRALWALVQTGPLAVPVLTNYLDISRYNAPIRAEIYRELSFLPLVIHAQAAIPLLLENAKTTNDLDRVLASFALVQIDKGYRGFGISNMVAVLEKTNSLNRTTAANLLGNIDPFPDEAIPAVEAARQSADPHLKREAEHILKRLKNKAR